MSYFPDIVPEENPAVILYGLCAMRWALVWHLRVFARVLFDVIRSLCVLGYCIAGDSHGANKCSYVHIANAQVVGRVVIDEFSHEVTAKDGTKGKATVVVTRDGKMLECTVTNPFPGEKMWLHWGFADRSRGWYSPPEKYLPADTKKIDDKACQSPFTNTLQLTVCEDDAPEAIAFVLKKDSPEEWYSGPTGDFWIAFKPADPNAVGGLIQHR